MRAPLAALVVMMCGCGYIQNVHEDLYIRGLAHKAYAHTNPHPLPAGHALGRDYERGWKQGFYNVSLGMDPCPPSVPPDVYWKPKYQCPTGRQAIDAWFAGFQAGTMTAQVDCYEDGRLPLGPPCQRAAPNACQGDCLQECRDCGVLTQRFATAPPSSVPENAVAPAPPLVHEPPEDPETSRAQAVDSPLNGLAAARHAAANRSLVGLQASRVSLRLDAHHGADAAILRRLPRVTDGDWPREASPTWPSESTLADRLVGNSDGPMVRPSTGLRQSVRGIADRRFAEPNPR